MNQQLLTCSKCGCCSFVERAVGPHIGVYCAECSCWQRWKKQSKEEKAENRFRNHMNNSHFGVLGDVFAKSPNLPLVGVVEEPHNIVNDEEVPWN